MTRTAATAIRRAVKSINADCKVTTIGTGRNVEVMLEGRDAKRIADQLTEKGFTLGHSFGNEIIVK